MEDTIINDEKEYKITSLWDRVKLEILERFYVLLNTYTEYRQYMISKIDSEEHRKKLTIMIENIWMLLKDYNSLIKTNELNDLTMLISTISEKNLVLNYEGIFMCMKNLSTLMNISGLTNIEFEKNSVRRAINNMS